LQSENVAEGAKKNKKFKKLQSSNTNNFVTIIIIKSGLLCALPLSP
jgi:hypothetical protein